MRTLEEEVLPRVLRLHANEWLSSIRVLDVAVALVPLCPERPPDAIRSPRKQRRLAGGTTAHEVAGE